MVWLTITLISSLPAFLGKCLAWLDRAVSLVQCSLPGFIAPSRIRYGSTKSHLDNRHDHRHSTKKPDWLNHEIIRIKATMPQAGCRSIADICNRRFAASRKITAGKTYVHQILQQHDYEIQILRRNIKHTKPIEHYIIEDGAASSRMEFEK